ncbi:ABC transporter substrate-binding protein [Sphingomonas sp. TREG-RG-20F-R18-01]|uniref:ABC transporter substrate-binding protein n=1 Tax=Sphingomonas sp. TREG-RG-20F-R18-01 TaxID=2914982 RepID=UPI001F572C44|nr:ABC transporter substrate-binding protein [Sphingomonas sp. TREG-RG-20F-R18-01]
MRWPLLLLALVSGCAEPQRGPIRRGGIVSTNPCADAMLVDLAPERIRAISRYSQDPTASSLPLDVARRFSTTAGTAEEVIALHPALVVTSSFTPIATQAAYRRAGLPVLTLDSPRSVAASEAQIRTLAEAVGEPQRGRAMVARIDAVLAAVPRRTPAIDALLFLGGSLANGPGNLLDELMRRAGFANAAQHYGLTYSASVTMETIVAAPPALLLEPGPTRGAMVRGKVLARMGAATRLATIPRALLNCGGPSIVPVITRLVAIRRTFG